MEPAQASAAATLFRRYNPGVGRARLAIWRTERCVCVVARAYEGGEYRRVSELPGLADAISAGAFAGQPTCLAYEGDSLVVFPSECSVDGLNDECPGSTAAKDFPSTTRGGT